MHTVNGPGTLTSELLTLNLHIALNYGNTAEGNKITCNGYKWVIAVQCTATVQYRAVQLNVLQCSEVQCSTYQCSAMQCNAV